MVALHIGIHDSHFSVVFDTLWVLSALDLLSAVRHPRKDVTGRLERSHLWRLIERFVKRGRSSES